MRTIVSTFALGLALAACSSEPEAPNATAPELTQSVPPASTAPAPSPSSSASPSPAASASAASDRVLALEGLGDLKIGAAVPQGSSWAERGAQIPGGCRTVSSPRYDGVYAIVTDGKVRRISVGQGSDVKLVEGVGPGATEREVRQWFGGFRAEPHKYEPAPAKYLTAPNAASGDPALRFEIGQDGKVSVVHVGTMPVLGYVEGCA